MEKEIRVLATDLEIRETDENKKMMSGYAVKWEQLSGKLGWFRRFQEKFQKGAFAETLQSDNQKALWNHNMDIVLGNTKKGTLRLKEDDIGLHFENDLPASMWGDCAHEAIKRGDIEGVSFGFRMLGEEWDESDPDNMIRTVTKAKLFEISPTPFPAYPQSEVQARTMDKAYEEYRAANKEPEPVTPPETEPGQPTAMDEQRKQFHELRSRIYKVFEEER